MGRLVQVLSGNWEKSLTGEWSFQKESGATEQYIVARSNEPIHTLESLVRTEFNILPETAMVLTYQLPDCMLIPNATQDRPTNVETSHDVEVLMSLHDWTDALTLCVTHGALNVEKYQFICRRPFNIGERRFLGDGVTEEQHTAEMLVVQSSGRYAARNSWFLSTEIRKAKDANEGI
ncbi:hypothetical protein Bca101_009344 [Brassica carinata]